MGDSTTKGALRSVLKMASCTWSSSERPAVDDLDSTIVWCSTASSAASNCKHRTRLRGRYWTKKRPADTPRRQPQSRRPRARCAAAVQIATLLQFSAQTDGPVDQPGGKTTKKGKRTGELGFEPRQADPESAVLPLHHSPNTRPLPGGCRSGPSGQSYRSDDMGQARSSIAPQCSNPDSPVCESHALTDRLTVTGTPGTFAACSRTCCCRTVWR
jgi:hypothetical protein